MIAGRKNCILLAAALLVAQSAAALAQDLGAPVAERIIVDGSYTIHKTTRLSGPALFPVTEYTVSGLVSYAGLNLTTQQGMDIFFARVNSGAKNLCGELDKVSPTSQSEAFQCVNTATISAVQKVTTALAAYLERTRKVASAR